jgi:hypothetical protein
MHRFAKPLLLLLLATALSRPLAGQETNDLADMRWQPEVATNPPGAAAFWFPVGEQLTYRVHWGVFQVAEAVVTTDWVRWSDGRLLLRIRYRTISNKFIASLYPVNDVIESYIDPATFLPVRFVKNMNEGTRHELAVTDFNHEKSTARWRKLVRKYHDWNLPIAPGMRDIPSLSYWLRKDGFLGNTTNQFDVMADDKIYKVSLAVEDLNETIPIPDFGLIPALKGHLEASFEGLFVRKGKVDLWVSKGAPCLILRIDAEVPVAKIKVRLSKISGVGAEHWKTIWPATDK